MASIVKTRRCSNIPINQLYIRVTGCLAGCLAEKIGFFLGQTACHLTGYNSFKVGNNATPIGCLVGFTPSLLGDIGRYRIIWSLICLFHKKSGHATGSLSPGTKKNNRRLVCMAHKHLGNTDLSTHLYLKHAICAAQHHPAFCVR